MVPQPHLPWLVTPLGAQFDIRGMIVERSFDGLIRSVDNAWDQLVALVVAYSFSVVGALILIVIGYILARYLQRWIYSVLGHVHGFDETLRLFLSRLVRYAVLVLLAVTVLAQFGVQTASILAALGAAGLAIGLALQGTLQNIAAGIMLLVLKPFRVGESIETNDVAGTVKEIGLFATVMEAADGVYMLVPNSELWDAPVTNFSRNLTRRNDLKIGIGYTDDIDFAGQTLLELARQDPAVLTAPAPETFVAELGDSTVIIALRYWTTTANWWQTKLRLTRAAKLAFDQNGISMPSPQRDVHLFNETPSPRQAAE